MPNASVHPSPTSPRFTFTLRGKLLLAFMGVNLAAVFTVTLVSGGLNQPVTLQEQLRRLILLILPTTGLAALAALIVAQRLTAPITRLSKIVAQVASAQAHQRCVGLDQNRGRPRSPFA